MLGHLLLFTFHIFILTRLPVGNTELCIDKGTPFDVEYGTVGEPLYAICPLDSSNEKDNFNVTWFSKDSQTEITSDRQARVHQHQKYLKFIPADLHDTGLYQCIFRNSTSCIKQFRRVIVVEHKHGLCYDPSLMFRLTKPMSPSHTIDCPNIDRYVNYKNVKVKWFKECQLLEMGNKHYSALGKTLIINNLSKDDIGNYTCEVPFTYNDVNYNITRTIDQTFSDIETKTEFVMISPTNNIIDVKLGASITLSCKGFYNSNEITFLYWLYNDSRMDFYSEDDRVIMDNMYETSTEHGKQYFMNLNFTKVIEEDYNKKFYCHMVTYSKEMMFYATLRKLDPSYQDFLIALFVSVFLVIILAIIGIIIFKVDIVLWYRSSCLANTFQKVADGKIYDAYIIYPKKSMGANSFEVDIFVQKVLPEVLEKECAYRLFISGRDDLPGQAVADLVEETISQSRRVIIVLGNIFCGDSGDDFEHKIAMYDALIHNKIKVILIEMEKIDYTDMPESINYIKQKQGALRWNGEFTDAALSPNTRFWKNIRYQMPPAPRHSDKELHNICSEDQ